MKKIKTMRIAAVLLILCLATTCAISGTFAKYTISAEATDTARVAKWGVDVSAATSATIFATTYDGTVVSSSSEKVVAPGTSGQLAGISISGQPEVKVKVTYSATVDLGDYWKDANGDYYCPLVVTVSGTEVNGKNQSSAEAFESAIKSAIDAHTNEYNAGTDLSKMGNDTVDVKWAWAYEGNDDAKDTALGNRAAAGNAPTISVQIVVTVTQVD